MAQSIRELLKSAAEASKEADEAEAKLAIKLANCEKNIGGLMCSFVSEGGNLRVRLIGLQSTPPNNEIDADTFSLICGWFGKHYIGGVMDENGKPQDEKEA